MTKREFLTVLAGATGAALIRPAGARADRIRILPGAPPDGDLPAVAGQASPERRRRSRSRRSRTPARGATSVPTERERATVPLLVVDNRGKAHALLLAGEILLGGKQNRVVTEDVLLPPLSGPVDLRSTASSRGAGTRAGEARASARAGRSPGSTCSRTPDFSRASGRSLTYRDVIDSISVRRWKRSPSPASISSWSLEGPGSGWDSVPA